jgi:hypothetical protein
MTDRPANSVERNDGNRQIQAHAKPFAEPASQPSQRPASLYYPLFVPAER